MFILSFALIILTGTLLLGFDAARQEPVSLIDRLFMATSATCVTGLSVVDLASRLSLFGQLCMLSMIQIGGLSLMIFSSIFILLLGKKISFKEKMTLKEALSRYDMENINTLVRYILFFTLITELSGALLLYLRWDFIGGFSRRLYYSLFHSVSAFCNAGFSLFSGNLARFQNDAVTVFAVTTLLILGGLGFFVHFELKNIFLGRIRNLFISPFERKERAPVKLSLHTKVVLCTTLILILAGVLFLGILEFNNVLAGKSWLNKFLIVYFQAVTPRTAGFNTVNTAALSTGSLLIIILLMFIGGAPGSTAGGIKTTSAATIFFTLRSILQGREKVTAFFKTISDDIVKKVLTIFVLALSLVLTAALIIMMKEGGRFSLTQVLFEVVSAFGTVGLSTGITSSLSGFSKLILVIVMFTGRVGPLTLAVSIMKKENLSINYPEENIGVG